jgi:hypothetical protein
MLFSNLVATIRADLDAIRDDLGEFVETVKTDASAVLGLEGGENNDKNGVNQAGKYLPWEDEVWNNPELLCENPLNETEWEAHLNSSPVKDEEVEALLSASETVHELYKELVPSKATHAEFFQRLFYHRNRLNEAARLKMKELVEDEEETRWEDDDDSIDAQKETPTTVPVETPVAATTKEEDIKNKFADEEYSRMKEENVTLANELDDCKERMNNMMARISTLEAALMKSEARCAELEALKLSNEIELSHKKAAPATIDEKPEVSPKLVPIGLTTGSEVTSWEALPTNNSSNDEVVVDLKHDDDDEDDWE